MDRTIKLVLSEYSAELCMKRIQEINQPTINSIEDYVAYLVLKDSENTQD